MSSVRDLINEPEVKDALLSNLRDWNMVCSAMDIVEDTEDAIGAYLDSPEKLDQGELYLRLYGVLQALFAQQDALSFLAKGLKIDKSKLPGYHKPLRAIRNASVGHAAEKAGFIVQVSITKRGFTLIKNDLNHLDRSEEFVDLIRLITEHGAIASATLSRLEEELRRAYKTRAR